jgi:DNA-binding NarL/FixJ family response regulator
MPVRVVHADDSLLIREGLEQILESEPGIELVASCGSVEELYAAVDAVAVDVVLTDIRMPPTMRDEGIRVASRLRETAPEVGVLVLSQHSNPGYALELLENGSERRGVLVKARMRRDASPLVALTPRELDVLAEIAQGKSNAAIAESLVLTKRAVEKHVNSIFQKLGLAFAEDVSKRVKAALLFLADREMSSG